MPLNGLNIDWAEKRLRIAVSGSGSHTGDGQGTYSVSGAGGTYFAPNIADVADGTLLSASVINDGTGWTSVATYNGPGAPSGGLVVTGAGPSCEAEIRVSNEKLWTRLTGNLPQLDGTLQVFVDGVAAIPPTSLGFVGAGVGPNYVPIFGTQLYVFGNAGAGTTGLPTFGPTDEYAYSSRCDGDVSFGWEYRETAGGPWIALPVSLAPGVENVECDDTSSGHITVSALSEASRSSAGTYYCDYCELPVRDPMTGEESVQVGRVTKPDGSPLDPLQLYDVYGRSEGKSGAAMALPDLPAALIRLAPGYRSTLYRDAFPSTTSVGGSSETIDSVTASTSTTTTVHPAQSVFKGSVGDTLHAIEDTLSYTPYAPCSSSTFWTETNGREAYNPNLIEGICNLTLEPTTGPCEDQTFSSTDGASSSFLFPASVQDGDTNPQLYDWQWHKDPILRYLAKWPNRFWHFFDWFPPNEEAEEDDVPKQDQWPLDGAAVPNEAYKSRLLQWAGESSLPSGERTKRLTDLVASGVDQHGMTLLYAALGMENLRGVGVSRFPVMECTPTAPKVYERCPDALELRPDSEPSWGSSDAALTFTGAGIEIVPNDSGDTEVTVDLALNAWSAPPYLYPQTCGSVTLDWSGIASVEAVWISGRTGTKTSPPFAAGDTIPIPTGKDLGYAGTWGHEDGNGWTEDQGIDVAPGGQSLDAMANPSYVETIGALSGHQAAILRLKITLGTTGVQRFKYPIFHRAAGTPVPVVLTGSRTVLLYPDGPGVLFGDLLWFDPDLGFLNPPLPQGLGYRSTIVDGISWRRAYLQGVSPLDGGTTGLTSAPVVIPALATELADRYTPFEGQSIAQADRDGWSFVLPGFAGGVGCALCNAYQEAYPPMAGWPVRARASGTYRPTGDPTGSVYDLAKEPRDVVTPGTGNPLVLRAPDGTLLSSSIAAPSGWSIERHLLAVENDEPTTYRLTRGARHIASVRPWHGWYWGGRANVESRPFIAYAVDTGWHRHRRIVGYDGTVDLGKADDRLLWSDLATEFEADAGDLAITKDDKAALVAVLVKDGSARVLTSEDDGATWTERVTGLAAVDAAIDCGRDHRRWVYRLTEDGNVYGRGYDASWNPITADTLVASDAAAIDCEESVSGGDWRMVLLVIADDGTRTTLSSLDGLTFTPI